MIKRYGIYALLVLLPSQVLAWQYAHDVKAGNVMVASAHHLASQVGKDILRKGGNAVDAAVAVGYALAVVHPCCGNLGGGGFMVIRMGDQTRFINFRERAPLKADKNIFLDAQGNVKPGASTNSFLAVGVPGSVLGLDTALQKYGTMSRQQVMAHAIRLARQGYTLGPADVQLLQNPRLLKRISKSPAAKAIFTKDGKPYQLGERLVQKQLASTLSQIAERGAEFFYEGPIARRIVEESQKNGGLLSLKDFKEYTVEDREPVTCRYRGYQVFSAAPPSSGGVTLCQTLRVLEAYPIGDYNPHDAQPVHWITEALRHAFADRNSYLGDPDFINNPIKRLLGDQYIESIRKDIKPNQATPSNTLDRNLLKDGTHTTHFSVVDKDDNAVTVTTTINAYFGSGFMAEKTGFFLNNEMDDFTAKPGVPNQFGLVQGINNAVAGGKRPLSSMTPTLVNGPDGKLLLATGSPGGSTIITTVLQILINIVDHKMDLYSAVAMPRFHHQWLPDHIRAEPNALPANTRRELEKMGYTIKQSKQSWGAAESVMRAYQKGLWDGQAVKSEQQPSFWHGVNDPRRLGGAAAGF